MLSCVMRRVVGNQRRESSTGAGARQGSTEEVRCGWDGEDGAVSPLLFPRPDYTGSNWSPKAVWASDSGFRMCTCQQRGLGG